LRKFLFGLKYYIQTGFFHLVNDEYRLVKENYIALSELYRLKSGNRNTSVLFDKKIEITDSFWYLHSLKELFADKIYSFDPKTDSPIIIDCGSNIGLSIIFFKRSFPNAKITGFEPDIHIFNKLQNNLTTYGYQDVTLENKAIWKEETMLSFNSSGGLGGTISKDQDNHADANIIKVKTCRLRNLLSAKVDLLKIDIEGAELEVLNDCKDMLYNVGNLFVEYHSNPEDEQELDHMLSILKEAGFRIYIKEAWNNLPYPFLHKQYKPHFDLQLNIFAYRK
jgi:FkbM family methyltransferase